MKVTVETLPQRQVVLNLEAEPDELEASKKAAYLKLVQRARIPGFRKGKAPMAILERYVGKAALLEEAISHLIPEATDKAISDEGIDAAGVPAIEVSGTEPVSWKATVDLAPEVDLGAYQDLRLEREAVEVGDEDVQRILENIRFQIAPWQPVDRNAEVDDLVTLDIHSEEGGKTVADDKGVQFRPMEDGAEPVPGFAKEIVGLGAGDEKEFTLAFQEDDERQEVAGKTFSFKVKAIDVKTKTLPDIDDEFAKGVEDGFDSLDALKEHISEQVKESKESQAKERLQEQAVQRLVETATVSYPPNMVEHQAEHLLEEQVQRMTQGQAGLDQYLQNVSKSKEELIEGLKPAATERVVRSLVLTELKTRENIEVTAEEVEAELDRLAASGGEQGAQLRALFGSERGREGVERSLLSRKTLDRLEEIVTQPAGEMAGKGETQPGEEQSVDDDES